MIGWVEDISFVGGKIGGPAHARGRISLFCFYSFAQQLFVALCFAPGTVSNAKYTLGEKKESFCPYKRYISIGEVDTK